MVREDITSALGKLEHLVEEAPAEAQRELALVKTKLEEAEQWLTKAEQVAGEAQTAVAGLSVVGESGHETLVGPEADEPQPDTPDPDPDPAV